MTQKVYSEKEFRVLELSVQPKIFQLLVQMLYQRLARRKKVKKLDRMWVLTTLLLDITLVSSNRVSYL